MDVIEDLYICTYFDPTESTIGMIALKDLDSLQLLMETMNVISWCNITGDNMQISKFTTLSNLKFNDNLELEEVKNEYNE